MSLYKKSESILSELDTALKGTVISRDRLTDSAKALSAEAKTLAALVASFDSALDAVQKKQAALEILHNSIDESTRKALQDSAEKQRGLNAELQSALRTELQQISQNIKTIEERIYEKQATLFGQQNDFVTRENAKIADLLNQTIEKNTQQIIDNVRKGIFTTVVVLLMTIGIGSSLLYLIPI